jgi:hypothetical protein
MRPFTSQQRVTRNTRSELPVDSGTVSLVSALL